jgi:hypothetical protein
MIITHLERKKERMKERKKERKNSNSFSHRFDHHINGVFEVKQNVNSDPYEHQPQDAHQT